MKRPRNSSRKFESCAVEGEARVRRKGGCVVTSNLVAGGSLNIVSPSVIPGA